MVKLEDGRHQDASIEIDVGYGNPRRESIGSDTSLERSSARHGGIRAAVQTRASISWLIIRLGNNVRELALRNGV